LHVLTYKVLATGQPGYWITWPYSTFSWPLPAQNSRALPQNLAEDLSVVLISCTQNMSKDTSWSQALVYLLYF